MGIPIDPSDHPDLLSSLPRLNRAQRERTAWTLRYTSLRWYETKLMVPSGPSMLSYPTSPCH
jgi:hypothetical protein